MNKNLLIGIGILCALITAAGIMQYKRPWHAKRIQESSYKNHDVSGLIKQLCAEDLAGRSQAQKELIKIGAPAKPLLAPLLKHSEPSVRQRARYVLKITGLVERAGLSQKLKNNIPDIYNDPYYILNNAGSDQLDAGSTFNLLLKIIVWEKPGNYPYKDIATSQDIAGLIGQILSDHSRAQIGPVRKRVILAACAGRYLYFDSGLGQGGINVGWHEPILEAVPHIIKLLDDAHYYTRGMAAITLVELGFKDKVPERVIPDMRSVRNSQNNQPDQGRAFSSLEILGKN